MTVREILPLINSADVKVFQTPIKELDGCFCPVLRQWGEVNVLLYSNQNYLDFEVQSIRNDNGIIAIMCKANKEQEQRIINTYRSNTR